MGLRRWIACCSLVASMAIAPGSGAGEPLRFTFEAPPSLDGAVAELRWLPSERWQEVSELVGLPGPGPPIRVLVVPEEAPLARRTPRWVEGFAVAGESVVVLLPERVSSYPYDSLPALLTHEVTHVLLDRATGGRELPRWFQEGVALLAARDWQLADRERLLVGGIGGVPPSTDALERAFAGDGYATETAYAIAGALAQDLVRRHGREVVAAIAREVAGGRSFDDAFATAAGTPLADFEAAFWRRFRLLYRWLPFATSGTALWLGVTALALAAMARRRARDAAIRRRWEDEESEPDRGDSPRLSMEGRE
jgi:hypothetical protein